jgi:hypothetical protein
MSQEVPCFGPRTLYNEGSFERMLRSTVSISPTHAVVYSEDCLCLWIDDCVLYAPSSCSAF